MCRSVQYRLYAYTGAIYIKMSNAGPSSTRIHRVTLKFTKLVNKSFLQTTSDKGSFKYDVIRLSLEPFPIYILLTPFLFKL